MIFDGLPIMSAGGGTKMSGPHQYFIKTTATDNDVYTLRLEGEGVMTCWGKIGVTASKLSGNINLSPIPETVYVSSSSTTISYTVSLEIDGESYTETTTVPEPKGITGGYVDIASKFNTTSNTVLKPNIYIFHEYMEITFTNNNPPSGTSGKVYGFVYYDLDADNPVTVTYA